MLTAFARLINLSICLLISSCVTGGALVVDPEYLSTAHEVRDVEYPANQITGRWGTLGYASQIRSSQRNLEDKKWHEFRAGGSGTYYQHTKDLISGKEIEVEGEITWSYLGRNRWRVNIPATSQFKTISSKGMSIGYRGPVSYEIRYHNGRIYVPLAKTIWVPADPGEFQKHISRMRGSRAMNQPAILIQ